MRRVASLPSVWFVLLGSLLVGSWLWVQARERDALRTRLEATSRQVAIRIEDFLARHEEGLRRVAAEVLLVPPEDEAAFRRCSASYQREHHGLQALNWVDPDGTIRWVEPEAPNRDALGFDLSRHPIAGGPFARARESGEVVFTPPLRLLQGGFGLAAYLRVGRNGGTRGFLNAVLRLPDLLGACVDGIADHEEFAFFLRHGEDLIGAFGLRIEAVPDPSFAESPVRIAGQRLTLSVVAPMRRNAAGGTWVDEALLAFGLLLAGALARLLLLARERRDRAESIAERLRVLIENAPDAIVAVDAGTGRLVGGNARAERLLGVAADDLDGLPIDEIGPERQPDGARSVERFREHLAAARRGEDVAFEWTVRDRRGRETLTEVHLVRLPNGDREIVRASFLDITRRHELELQLRRTQAHEAMGRLAGGVAHDFNNLLTVILGSAEAILERHPGDPESSELAEGIVGTCERAAKLTRQLLAFSRRSALDPKPLDLNALVPEFTPMLERALGERIRLDLDLRAGAPIVADRSQIELALLNLAINARDAMPGGGRITIASADAPDDRVSLRVTDEGEGIAPEILDRVFEPFFTTKDPEVGSGIGLAAVRQIVEQAGGRISVASEPGVGTTFEAVFPAHHGPLPGASPRRAPTTVRGGGEVVLLVEDNPSVLGVLRRALTERGYRVLAAESAEQALRLADDRADERIDLIVTDIVLAKRSGLDLVKLLRERRPGLAALLVSGYASADVRLDSLGAGPTSLLTKPFGPSVLLERIDELLGVDAPL
ncbi:MAG: ATP-binding protein [Planctomycetota bacterium JB042]